MSAYTSVNHKIQKNIIDYLATHATGRFRDLRPKGVDTNRLTYHVTKLLNFGLIEKVADSYQLTVAGLEYADRTTDDLPRIKTIIMFLVQNDEGDVLIEQLSTQPFIDRWTLPCGRLRPEDPTVQAAAERLAVQKFSSEVQPVHAGNCYIRLKQGKEIFLTTQVHLFTFNTDKLQPQSPLAWARPHKLGQYKLAPAVEAIVARGFFRDPFFFEEFEVDWYNEAV